MKFSRAIVVVLLVVSVMAGIAIIVASAKQQEWETSYDVNLPKKTKLAVLDLSQIPADHGAEDAQFPEWRPFQLGDEVDFNQHLLPRQFLENMNGANQQRGFLCRIFTTSVGRFNVIECADTRGAEVAGRYCPSILQLPSGKYVAITYGSLSFQQVLSLDGKIFLVCHNDILEWSSTGEDKAKAKVVFSMNNRRYDEPRIKMDVAQNLLLGRGLYVGYCSSGSIIENFHGLAWYQGEEWRLYRYEGKQKEFWVHGITCKKASGNLLLTLYRCYPGIYVEDEKYNPRVLFNPKTGFFADQEPAGTDQPSWSASPLPFWQ